MNTTLLVIDESYDMPYPGDAMRGSRDFRFSVSFSHFLSTSIAIEHLQRGLMGTPHDADAYASLQTLLGACEIADVLRARDALRAGRMEGLSTHTCLIAQLARARGQEYMELNCAVFGRDTSPIEVWVMAYIHSGLTPQNSAHAAQLDAWLSEWIDAHTLELATSPHMAEALERRAPVLPPRTAVVQFSVDGSTWTDL